MTIWNLPRWASTRSLSSWGRALAADTLSLKVSTMVRPLAWARRSRSGSWSSRDWSWVDARTEMAAFTEGVR